MTITLTPLSPSTQFFNDLFVLTNQLVAALANNTLTANNSANGSATVGNTYFQGIFAGLTINANTLGGGNVQSSANLSISTNTVMLTGTTFYNGNVTANSTVLAVGSCAINTSYFSIGTTLANASTITVSNIWGSPTINSNIQVLNNANVANTLFVGANIAVNTSSMVLGTTLQTSVNVTTTGTGSQVIDSWLLSAYRSAEYHLVVKDNAANNFQASKLLTLQDGTNGYITEYSVLNSNTVNMGAFTISTNATAVILNFTPVSANTTVKGHRFAVSV